MLSAYSKRDYVPWLLGFAMCFTWIVLSYATGTSLLGPTSFNSYSRQAMAWRQGKVLSAMIFTTVFIPQ